MLREKSFSQDGESGEKTASNTTSSGDPIKEEGATGAGSKPEEKDAKQETEGNGNNNNSNDASEGILGLDSALLFIISPCVVFLVFSFLYLISAISLIEQTLIEWKEL